MRLTKILTDYTDQIRQRKQEQISNQRRICTKQLTAEPYFLPNNNRLGLGSKYSIFLSCPLFLALSLSLFLRINIYLYKDLTKINLTDSVKER